jgi:hypothetical protein
MPTHGEYDVCGDVTLSVYPHWASLRNMPGHIPVTPNRKPWLLDYIDIEETRLSSEISHTRTDLTVWRHYSNVDHLHFHLLLNIDTTSKMKHGNEMDFQTLKRRRFKDVETTSISRRWNDVDFQTLKRRRFLNVDSVCVFNPFSTSIRRHPLTSFRRCFDVALPAGKQHLTGW